jgi:hypothetical protein
MTHEELDELLRRIHQHHVEDDEEDIADHDDVSVEDVWAIANNTC